MKQLLDFIAKPESGGDYNIVWGGIKRADHPPRALVQMTVGEVLDWQDSIDSRYMSEAAGRYQIMEDTLRGLYREAGVPLNAPFNAETQDRLAVALLRRRGLDDYLAGRMSAEKFANALAREWASLPVVTGPKKGRSYYAGDGLNNSHVSVADFMAAVRAVKLAPSASARPEPRDSAAKSSTIQAAAGQAAAGIGAAASGIAALDGTAQTIAVVGGLVVVALAVWIMRERLRHWAAGVR